LKYLRKALTKSWNLLLLAGGCAVAWWSGEPTVWYAVGGAELAYLTFAVTSPAFRMSVDIQDRAAERKLEARAAEQTLQRMLRDLPPAELARFRQLRQRCLELEKLAKPLSRETDSGMSALTQFQVDGLDELLWIYLKLLYSHHALDKFTATTKPELIAGDVRRYKERLAEELDAADEVAKQQRAAWIESLRSSEERLANAERAVEQRRLAQIELERLETQIRALSEQTISRHNRESLAKQAELVAESLRSTEASLNEFRAITGLDEDSTPPALLKNSTLTMR
jgi:FtsZ-binding cell division protein ZapB